MEKPKSIEQFINGLDPHDRPIVIEALKLYERCVRWDHRNICAICDKELTTDELGTQDKNDFLYTCIKHRRYRKNFDASIVRLQLGYPQKTYLTFYENGI